MWKEGSRKKLHVFVIFSINITAHSHTQTTNTFIKKKYTLDFNKYKYKKIFLRLTTTTINNTTTLTKKKNVKKS